MAKACLLQRLQCHRQYHTVGTSGVDEIFYLGADTGLHIIEGVDDTPGGVTPVVHDHLLLSSELYDVPGTAWNDVATANN